MTPEEFIHFEILLFSVYCKKCIATNSTFNLSLFYIVNIIIIYGSVNCLNDLFIDRVNFPQIELL